jgi:hypothetical protein
MLMQTRKSLGLFRSALVTAVLTVPCPQIVIMIKLRQPLPTLDRDS